MFASVSRRRQALSLSLAAAVAGILFIDMCGLIFGCGCTSLWAGGAALCNVYHATGPHCPWCAHPGWGGAVAFFSVSGAQAAVAFWPAAIGLVSRMFLALAVGPLVGGAVGLAHGVIFGYWS